MAAPVKPNAATQKIRDDRAAAKAAGKRYVRATPAPAAAPAAKPKVNATTQAIRDDRAEAKGKGQVYKRSVPAGSAAAKARAKMGVNEVLMNRRLTIRTAAKKKAAAAAKTLPPDETQVPSRGSSGSSGSGPAQDPTHMTIDPPGVHSPDLTPEQLARIKRKKDELAAGK